MAPSMRHQAAAADSPGHIDEAETLWQEHLSQWGVQDSAHDPGTDVSEDGTDVSQDDMDASEDDAEWLRSRVFMTVVIAMFLCLFIPCLGYGTTWTLVSLMEVLEDDVYETVIYLLDVITDHRSNIAHGCCSKLSGTPSPVYLVSSTIDLLNLSRASKADSNHVAKPTMPLTELVEPRIAHRIRHTMNTQHWTIVIREMAYDLMRKKEPKGSRDIELRAFQFKGDLRADALGLELEVNSVYELGVTFLSEGDLLFALDLEDLANRELGALIYNPMNNNCQNIWRYRLLRRVVCRCRDQPICRYPSTLRDSVISTRFRYTIGWRLGSFLVLFAKRGYFGLDKLWLTRAHYPWLHLLFELFKYHSLWRCVRTMLVPTVRPGVVLTQRAMSGRAAQFIDELGVSLAEDSGARSDQTGGPIDTTWFNNPRNLETKLLTKAESERLWLPWLMGSLCLVDTVFGTLARFREGWWWWDWVDLVFQVPLRQMQRGFKAMNDNHLRVPRQRPCMAKAITELAKSDAGWLLYYASEVGLERTATRLVRQGADVNAPHGEHGTALQAASFGGHVPIVRLLIDASADVNATGGRYGNALQAALHQGHDRIVQLLLASGANVDAAGGEHGDALQAALHGGQEKVVQMLREWRGSTKGQTIGAKTPVTKRAKQE